LCRRRLSNLDEIRRLLDAIMSEGLAKIEALSDDELREIVTDEG
jgi:hypothetical protein